ncbi:hypothetical protein N7466_005818 [Penicillium verhagenii]|uniref:uncharacterized protein n=1 Tax=Penicillium verhagenii TaxID=1562060 RepID=UPI00254521C2|nr:uncharacterized protein N7466_005818 [Penicillium verhagenii]KAJ5930325.1 hypothetical protein N7466_005818 [Penicillium verhagenii]
MSQEYYMSCEIVKAHFAHIHIVPINSWETAVDRFWVNVLNKYFTRNYNFDVITQTRPDSTRELHTEITVQRFLVYESKCAYEGRTARWKEALDQLEGYLQATFINEPGTLGPLYGAVAIGRFVRFYVIEHKNDRMHDFNAKPGGEAYHVEGDEEDIHGILETIRDAAIQLKS